MTNHSNPSNLHISDGTRTDVSPPPEASSFDTSCSSFAWSSGITDKGTPATRPSCDLQMHLLIVDDPLIRRTLGERALQLRQDLTRKDQTPFEDRLVEQACVAWGWQAALRYLLQQLDVSQRQRNELRRKYNIAYEHLNRCLNDLNAVRAAIITKLSTEQAANKV